MNLLDLKSQNQAKNISVNLPKVPQSKFEANRSRCSWVMIGQANRQTERQTNRDFNFTCIIAWEYVQGEINCKFITIRQSVLLNLETPLCRMINHQISTKSTVGPIKLWNREATVRLKLWYQIEYTMYIVLTFHKLILKLIGKAIW